MPDPGGRWAGRSRLWKQKASTLCKVVLLFPRLQAQGADDVSVTTGWRELAEIVHRAAPEVNHPAHRRAVHLPRRRLFHGSHFRGRSFLRGRCLRSLEML